MKNRTLKKLFLVSPRVYSLLGWGILCSCGHTASTPAADKERMELDAYATTIQGCPHGPSFYPGFQECTCHVYTHATYLVTDLLLYNKAQTKEDFVRLLASNPALITHAIATMLACERIGWGARKIGDYLPGACVVFKAGEPYIENFSFETSLDKGKLLAWACLANNRRWAQLAIEHGADPQAAIELTNLHRDKELTIEKIEANALDLGLALALVGRGEMKEKNELITYLTEARAGADSNGSVDLQYKDNNNAFLGMSTYSLIQLIMVWPIKKSCDRVELFKWCIKNRKNDDVETLLDFIKRTHLDSETKEHLKEALPSPSSH